MEDNQNAPAMMVPLAHLAIRSAFGSYFSPVFGFFLPLSFLPLSLPLSLPFAIGGSPFCIGFGEVIPSQATSLWTLLGVP